MEVIIRPDAHQATLLAARIIAQTVRQKPTATLGLATGRTPLALYAELIRMHREENLDFSQVTTFNLDEYIGLPITHPQSYHFFMRKNFFSQVNISPDRIYIPDGMASDPQFVCRAYEKQILDAGGIDLQVLGLGSNGHIGFNEPFGSLSSRTWIKILSQSTLRDNAALFDNPDEIPRHVITMGIGTILDTRRCVLLAFGEKKAKATAQMIEGPIAASCPASALQLHRQVTVVLDEAASSELHHRDHYEWIDQNKLPWQRY